MNLTNEEIQVILSIFKNININQNKVNINDFVSLEKKNINLRTVNGFVPVSGFSVETYYPNGIGNKILEFVNFVDAIKEIKKTQAEWEIDCLFENIKEPPS